MKNKCSFEKCELETFYENSNCILHVNYKKTYPDVIKIPPNLNFKEYLVKYIVDYIFNHNLQKQDIHTTELATKHYLYKGSVSGHLSQILKIPIKFKQLGFPLRFEGEADDYQYILNKFKTIEFIDCDLDCDSLNNMRVPCSFSRCRFTYDEYTIFNHEILDKKIALYSNCCFYGETKVTTFDNVNFKGSVFNDCIFRNRLKLENATFIDKIFNSSNNNINRIFSLYIKNCLFKNKFILNNFEKLQKKAKRTGLIDISHSIFESKFELKNNNVGTLQINDTNFENIVDFFNTDFDKVHFKKCIIENFIGFENCEFGSKEVNNKSEESKFVFTTFKSIPNFRNTKFGSGLDIETANFKDIPNFLKTEISCKNTNRETFRIIKNSFDKVGNHIEANKFFALEMDKYREELEESNDKHGLLIYKLNNTFSNFGQNYKKPFWWLLGSVLLLFGLSKGQINNVMYKINPNFSYYFEKVSICLNDFAKNFLPFKKTLIEGMEFISLFFNILFMILIWQIIVAVKRHTKR